MTNSRTSTAPAAERLPPDALKPRHWPLWLGIGLLWSLAQLPPRWTLALGRGMGRLLYPLLKRRRRIALKNFELAFPELDARARERLARENFRYTGQALAESVLAWWTPAQRLSLDVELRGQEHLEAALTEGRGVILLSAHFTCLELVGRLLAQKIPLCALFRPHKNPLIEHFMGAARRRNLHTAIPRSDLRGMLRQLKAGRPVWYAGDQDFGTRQSVFAPFFGVPTSTLTAASKLAKASSAPVVPMFYYQREDRHGYVVEFGPALEGFPSGDEVTDAARMNALIEAAVREHPAQYLWVHRRFKTRPEGAPSPY